MITPSSTAWTVPLLLSKDARSCGQCNAYDMLSNVA